MRRRIRSLLCVSLSVVGSWLAIDCGPSTVPTPAPIPTATIASAASSSSSPNWTATEPTLPPEDPNVPILERVRARGTAHVPPVRVPATKNDPERWLVYLGTDAALHALWVVSPNGPSPSVVVEMPRGVRVLGTVISDTKAYVWIESLAVLDQPAGLKIVAVVDTKTGARLESRESPASLADLEKQVATPAPAPALKPIEPSPKLKPILKPPPAKKPVPPPKKPDPKPKTALEDPLEAIKAADQSVTALTKAIPKDGIELVRTWQGTFDERVARVSPLALATSPHLADIRAAVHAAADNGFCFEATCRAVLTAREDGRIVLKKITLDPPAPAPLPPGAKTKLVTMSANGLATETAVRKTTGVAVKKLHGEAPLGPTGATIGLATIDRETDSQVMVIATPTYVAITASYDGSYVDPETLAIKTRFADIDGDGATDMIVQASGKWDGKASESRVAYRSPRSLDASSYRTADDASTLALWATADLDSALQKVLALPLRGTTNEEACKLVKQLTSPAGFTAATIPKAPILSYNEPGIPSWRVRTHTSTSIDWSSVLGAPASCDSLTCDPDRPVCTFRNEPSIEYYWLGWPDGVMKLVGIEYYTGS